MTQSDLISRRDAIDKIESIDMQVYEGNAAVGRRTLLTKEEVICAIDDAPSAEPERTAKVKTNWATYYDNMGTAIIHIPYAYKCGNCGCELERTYNGKDIHYCPACGAKLIWQ